MILWGANNIFSLIFSDGSIREARLKGKVLALDDEPHNPLSPGDYVQVDESGQITHRCPRTNAFHRWNKKRMGMQTLAANIDQVLIMGCVQSPPFRPRFIDRALLCAQYDDIQSLVVINKVEGPLSPQVQERIGDFSRLGYPVIPISVHTGYGLDELARVLHQKTTAFVGQSGVGKSSLLNTLLPDVGAKIGDVSEKYQRGRHTTTLSRCYPGPDSRTYFIDTPGVRELDVSFIEPDQLGFYFPEFEEFRSECAISGCTHNHEPHCRVEQAFEDGLIHEDRYESYLRILEEITYARKGRYSR